MLKKYFILIFLIAYFSSYAQINLVPNPSFEYYTNCPYAHGQLPLAYPWITTYYKASTAEYLNKCCIDVYGMKYSVPKNYFGYQYPRTGNGYSGAAISLLENLEVKLLKPLEKGKKYQVSFYVCLANISDFGIDAIGAYFSKDTLKTEFSSVPLGADLDYFPELIQTAQINNPTGNIISDSINWVKISGEFISTGNENYMTIARFKKKKDVKYIGSVLLIG